MGIRTGDRTGILIARIWIEGDRADGLRARITRTLDSSGSEQTVATAATHDAILSTVSDWVDAFLAAN